MAGLARRAAAGAVAAAVTLAAFGGWQLKYGRRGAADGQGWLVGRLVFLARGRGQAERECRAHLDRLLRLALQPERHRCVEEHRVPVAVRVDEFGDQLRAETVGLATRPVDLETWLITPRFQRQDSAYPPPAGPVEHVRRDVVGEHAQRRHDEPPGPVRVGTGATAAYRVRGPARGFHRVPPPRALAQRV